MKYREVLSGTATYFKKQRIRVKLMLALVPSVVLILTITGYITCLVSNSFLKEAIKRTVTLNTLAVAHEIELVFEKVLKDMNLIHKAYVEGEDLVKTYQNFAIINGFPYAEIGIFSTKNKSCSFLTSFTNENVRCFSANELQYIKPNPSGIFFKYINSEISADYFTEVVEVIYPSLEGQLQHGPIPVFRIYKPIVDKQGVISTVIVVGIPAGVIKKILSLYNSEESPLYGYARTPEPRFLYFFDLDGWILFGAQQNPQQEKSFSLDLAFRGLSGSFGRPFFREAFRPNREHVEFWNMVEGIKKMQCGVFTFYQELEGSRVRECYTGYAPIRLEGKQVVAGVSYFDRSRLEIFAGYKHVDVMFILTLSSIVLAVLIILLISRVLTRPILELVDAVNKIKGVDSISTIEIQDSDYETDLLKDAINQLLLKIQEQVREIEIRDKHILKTALMEKVDFEDMSHGSAKEDLIPEIVGNSSAIMKVKEEVVMASNVDADILIVGETGTGKQLLAEAIHRLSPRRHGPFVSINCGALDENLLLDTLFGHKKGAFTEARTDRKGAFLSANGGTLFLDEIACASLKVQQALLTALSLKKIKPLGSDEEVDVDVKVIAATNQDLRKLVEEKAFREDLYYRLNVISITIPPLRERKEDLPLLIWNFMERFKWVMGRENIGLSQGAYNALLSYDWPGNVRELEHCIKRAIAMAKGEVIKIEDLPIQDMGVNKLFNVVMDSSDNEINVTVPKLNKRQRVLLNLLVQKGEITRSEYQELMGDNLPSRTAIYDLQQLVSLGLIEKIGKGPATRYRLIRVK